MSLSGNGSVAAVGSTADPSGAAGKSYVYVKPTIGWKNTSHPAATLSNNGSRGFGQAVALSGDGGRVVVGRSTDVTLNRPQESAYVYDRPKNGWASTASPSARLFVAAGTSAKPAGAYAVAIDNAGDTALTGIIPLSRAAIFSTS